MSNNDTGASIVGWLLSIYAIVSQIMSVVFFVQYCKADDSLVEIIFIDSVLSE